jgi:two-component system phosphate regulon sensor histidine kinase PhoR
MLVTANLELAKLNRWLKNPRPESVPDADGPWGYTYINLYRLQKKAEHGAELLREALSRFQDAGAALPDGVVIMDEYDRIEWCNPLAETHLGITLEKDRGQQLTYIMRQPVFLEWLSRENYDKPLTLRNARGIGITLLFSLVRYGAREKLVVSRDITALDNAERVRRDFVANVSHELRTPITVISGFLETLEDSEEFDPEGLRHALSLMRNQAERMNMLVEELLNISRLESDLREPAREDIDIAALLELLHRETTQLSRGRHKISLSIESADTLIGARSEIHSAMSNLTSNAVRYTPDGGSIDIAWRRTPEGASFTVQDSGIGIEAEHIPRLTERFYRVDKSRSRDTGGTGLGLAIVQHVLNRHQGRLDIKSTPGLGSTFIAHFPLERIVAPNDQRNPLKVS